jgi:hypothetical protein
MEEDPLVGEGRLFMPGKNRRLFAKVFLFFANSLDD